MEGYKKKLKLFNVGKISVFSTLVFFLVYIVALVLHLAAIKGALLATGKVWSDAILAVGLVAIGIVAHELLHAAGALLFGKASTKDIQFGAQLKQGLFYCHCKKPITIAAYRGMLVLPILITGIIPFVVCLFYGGLILTAAFAMLIAGGVGDVAMFVGTLKEKDSKRLVLDHPKTTAYYVLYKQEEFDGEELTEDEEEKLIAESQRKGAASLGVKILLVAVFLALTVLAIYIVALIMQFI